MKKILFLLLLSTVTYGQVSNGTEQEFDYGIKNNAATTVLVPNYLTTQGADGTYGKIEPINLPVSTATQDSLNKKLNVSDVPSNLMLYATNVAADIGGYFKLVNSISDPDYNATAVDINTGSISTTGQLLSSSVAPIGLVTGQPGVINVTTVGNIKRLSGTGTANFYFQIFHRTAAGIETLIGTSSATLAVSSSTYQEFYTTAIWNDGIFLPTDRVVIKFYANRLAGGVDPVYNFQFGGAIPVRSIVPVPFSVVAGDYELKANKQNSLVVDGTGVKFPTIDAVNTIGLQKVIDVNGYAEVDGGNSYLSMFDGILNDRYFDIQASNGSSSQSSLSLSNTNSEIFGFDGFNSAKFTIANGILKLIQSEFSTTTKSTSLNFITPTLNTTIQVPAKSTVGTYTLATLDDIPAPVDISGKANIDSPAFTGIPTAPTAAAGTNTTQLATTAFVTSNTNSNAVLLTGNQSITGTKTFTTTDIVPNIVSNNAYGSSSSVGISSNNNSIGTGIYSISTAGIGIRSDNNSLDTGIYSYNTSSGYGIYSNNISTGVGIRSYNTSTGTGLYTYNTSTGKGSYFSNSSTGIGMYAYNASSGKSLVLNNTTAATGMPFTVSKNGVDALTINDAGEITGNKFIKTGGTSSQFLKADGSVDSTVYGSGNGTVTSVTGTNGVTVATGTTTPVIGLGAITPTSTNGVTAATMAYMDATASVQTQLNGKQATLTNPVTGTGTTNSIPKFTASGAIGNSNITDNGTVITTTTDMIVSGIKIGKSGGGVATNTVIGVASGNLNTTGDNNLFCGHSSGANNTSGLSNVFLGASTGASNLTGSSNLYIGHASALNNLSGSNNNAFGRNSGRYIADKSTPATIFNNSILIGYRTSPLADNQTNQIVIGYDATGLGSNTTVLGNASTVKTAIYGNLLLKTTTDNGIDDLQVPNGSIIANGIKSTGIIRLKGYTVATLPTGVQGDTAFVTDALAPTYMVAIAGGGAVVTKVFYNGTNWIAD